MKMIFVWNLIFFTSLSTFIELSKALILGQWHSLSDEELERSLKIRVDFILFTGFRVGETPDATTLCRFKNKLIEEITNRSTLLRSVAVSVIQHQ